jgi:3-hydroxy-D-aspartate aldolase
MKITRQNPIGTPKQDLETPCLLVDLDTLERNLQTMARYCAAAHVNLRPHTKTHKSPALAQMQIAAGARGICCGNLRQAEGMISAGIRDVLVTKEIVLPQQIARVAELARDSELIAIVDNAEVAENFSRAATAAGTRIRVFVDVDVRLGRSGVAPGEATRALVRQIQRMRELEFLGLMGYEGSMHDLDASEREKQCQLAYEKLVGTKELIERDGSAVQIVSAGSTNTFGIAAKYRGITEVQPGSYLTSDARYQGSEFKPAVSVLTTVISRPSKARVTTDAGQKNLSQDAGKPLVKARGEVRFIALNEEHGLLESSGEKEIRVGEKIELIPSHGGTTINMYSQMYGMRDERVEDVWEIVG